MAGRWIRRHGVTIGCATAAAAAVAGIAGAAIPGGDGTIAGCYAKGTGALRVIDAEAGVACSVGETRLDWNQRGPQGWRGPTGPQGAQGVQGWRGPTGPQGAQGTRGMPGAQGAPGPAGANDQHWAHVGTNGTVLKSSESYIFVWNERAGVKDIYMEDVANTDDCVATAQQSPATGTGTPAAASATTSHWDGWVTVYTYNALGLPTDADFSVIVACGRTAAATGGA